ncbi:hypothetical protein Kpho02_34550 [Kitasatospora phosalacinea]|uniref:Uncharacterized protein n=1 Tax=Kitasatospora phosalacinea TaxID=2065 RepID=A0A9W6Q9B8_9ACTN|nr:hypothetical protein Kpho02_34550 [Kitasatospora phosalacinea]
MTRDAHRRGPPHTNYPGSWTTAPMCAGSQGVTGNRTRATIHRARPATQRPPEAAPPTGAPGPAPILAG